LLRVDEYPHSKHAKKHKKRTYFISSGYFGLVEWLGLGTLPKLFVNSAVIYTQCTGRKFKCGVSE
jgi:hypothetical protein